MQRDPNPREGSRGSKNQNNTAGAQIGLIQGDR